jgi:hypothetical protein
LPYQARIPKDLYADLYRIRHSLVDPQYISDAPSIQDLVNVALKRLIRDWHNPAEQSLLSEELLEQRKIARSKMGRKRDSTQP